MAATERKGHRLHRRMDQKISTFKVGDPRVAEAAIYERLSAAEMARDSLSAFARYMHPHPEHKEDVGYSMYQLARPHRAIADALTKLENGAIKRLIINAPPRHGKTELAAKLFIPWVAGKNPSWSVIFATYNHTYSEDIGRAVRSNLASPLFHQVFPDPESRIRTDSQSMNRLQNIRGSIYAFVGRGGTLTGRGGHLLIVDDLLKDRKEADSQLVRDQQWDWLNQVFRTRMMDRDARILLIQTRWHADDVVGRITDRDNDHYTKETAANWHILDLPALAMQHDPLGRAVGEPLWPERFDRNFFAEIQASDARGFAALYQGQPALPGMRFFEEEWLRTYGRNDAPKPEYLRMYCASDHALSVDQSRDKTCLIPFGVDQQGDIWIMPDVWWRHASTDVVVEGMLHLIRKYKPLAWFAERGHISKSIGPFLRKRMLEEGVYASVRDMPLSGDKQTRAQSIQGRMAMKKVRFPGFAQWWQDARRELLQFPAGGHDDFVDSLAWCGLGLDTMVSARTEIKTREPFQPFTLGAIRAEAQQRKRDAAMRNHGW